MSRYRVIENIPAGNTLWFDEASREVRAKRVSDCRTIDSRRPMICTAGLVFGDEINPDSNAVFIGGRVEAMSAHVLYAPEPVAEETKSDVLLFDPADIHRFTVCGANQTSNLVDVQPKYGESAMTSEAIGGAPKPNLEWRIRRIDWLHDADKNQEFDYAFRVSLWVDGVVFATDDVKRPEAGKMSERQSRKIAKKIAAAKAGIMRTYLLTVRESGPANRTF